MDPAPADLRSPGGAELFFHQIEMGLHRSLVPAEAEGELHFTIPRAIRTELMASGA